jgi:hypothetical protein
MSWRCMRRCDPRPSSWAPCSASPSPRARPGFPLVNVVPLPLTRPYLKAGRPILPNVTERPSFPPPLRRPFNRALGALFLHLPLLTGNFNKVARRYGLPPFPSMMGVWEGDYNLAADVPLLMDLPLPDELGIYRPTLRQFGNAGAARGTGAGGGREAVDLLRHGQFGQPGGGAAGAGRVSRAAGQRRRADQNISHAGRIPCRRTYWSPIGCRRWR